MVMWLITTITNILWSLEDLIINGKRWRASEEKLGKVKGTDKFGWCGTAASLLCDFVFLNFGKKFLS